jgi:hypothetical protein
MKNSHNFDSYQGESNHNFNSYVKNSHVFNSFIKNSWAFNTIVDFFHSTNTWITKIKTSQVITASMSFFSNFNAIVSIPNILININNNLISIINGVYSVKFISDQVIKINKMKLLQKMDYVIFATTNQIKFIYSDVLNIYNLIITIPDIYLNADMTRQHMTLLSELDSYLLSDLDSQLLQDLDYTTS